MSSTQNKGEASQPKNFIIGVLNIKEKDLNKPIQIISSYEYYKENNWNFPD